MINRHTPLPCGSELARESGMAVNIDVEADGPIASKLAPTRFQCRSHNLSQAQNLWKRACSRKRYGSQH
ncbi:hypothetical protein PSJE_22800 [Pseudomonas jessenii]|nr:hypothetical protein PSJE_22800 [Pseudomonas jessenii]